MRPWIVAALLALLGVGVTALLVLGPHRGTGHRALVRPVWDTPDPNAPPGNKREWGNLQAYVASQEGEWEFAGKDRTTVECDGAPVDVLGFHWKAGAAKLDVEIRETRSASLARSVQQQQVRFVPVPPSAVGESEDGETVVFFSSLWPSCMILARRDNVHFKVWGPRDLATRLHGHVVRFVAGAD